MVRELAFDWLDAPVVRVTAEDVPPPYAANLEHLALPQVENIGAGHAATALSQMTDRRIMISVPKITVARLEEVAGLLGDPQQVVAAILLHMLGDLTGRTLLVFPGEGHSLEQNPWHGKIKVREELKWLEKYAGRAGQ